jgi:hypothetical protein
MDWWSKLTPQSGTEAVPAWGPPIEMKFLTYPKRRLKQVDIQIMKGLIIIQDYNGNSSTINILMINILAS